MDNNQFLYTILTDPKINTNRLEDLEKIFQMSNQANGLNGLNLRYRKPMFGEFNEIPRPLQYEATENFTDLPNFSDAVSPNAYVPDFNEISYKATKKFDGTPDIGDYVDPSTYQVSPLPEGRDPIEYTLSGNTATGGLGSIGTGAGSAVGNAGAAAAAGNAAKKAGLLGGFFSKNGGGTMKEGFTLPTLNQAFGNANLGYSLNGGYYDNAAKAFLTKDQIASLGDKALNEGIASGKYMETNPGLNLGGYQLGNLYTAGDAVVNLGRGVSNLDKLNKISQQGSDLKADILATAASTPNVSNYLTTDEQKMLNQLKRGNYVGDSWGEDLSDWGGVLGGGVKGALAGLPGGIPGMIVGGLGGAVNGGLSGAAKKKEANNSKLDSLYNTLSYARNDYNSMKRPNFAGLGIQQRYRNAYA